MDLQFPICNLQLKTHSDPNLRECQIAGMASNAATGDDQRHIPRLSIANCKLQIANRSSGFSFVEILFAVMILGIGFIMISAIFPVAIQQTQSSTDDVTAAAVARQAVNCLAAVASDTTMPGTGVNVTPVLSSTPLWNAINGNLILSSDPRYAWTALYRRDNSRPPYAQVFVIVARVRTGSSFTDPTIPLTNLACRNITVTLADGGTASPDTATISGAGANAVAEGTFIVLDNGRIYRVGNQSGTSWELMPGYDIADATTENVNGATAYILGRTAPAYDGPAQDIAVYSTFIPVN